MNRLELRKTLLEEGIDVSHHQIESAIKWYGFPLDDLDGKQVEKLKAHFQAKQRPSARDNGNGKQFKTEELQPDAPAPKQTATGFSAIQDQVNSAIGGLKQAELALAASAFERLNNQFEIDTDRISQAAEVLLDPRVKVATGILKAANRINDRQEEPLQIPFGGYQFELPQIPGVPDFGQFYSQQQQSDRLLSVGNNTNEQNGQSNEPIASASN